MAHERASSTLLKVVTFASFLLSLLYFPAFAQLSNKRPSPVEYLSRRRRRRRREV